MMTARSSDERAAGSCVRAWNDARSSSVPARSSSSVNTLRTPALKASFDSQPKFFVAQTTTAGSALPMKYSISPAW